MKTETPPQPATKLAAILLNIDTGYMKTENGRRSVWMWGTKTLLTQFYIKYKYNSHVIRLTLSYPKYRKFQLPTI